MSDDPARRYVLITPCRDEAAHMQRTLNSVAAQSVPPALWVVVDDGSNDDTPAILAEYASRLPYLRVISRQDTGERRVGGGVVEAFNVGLDSIDLDDFAYVCKFDMDLDIPPRYFELLMERMEADPRIGTCSGKPWFRAPGGRKVYEVCDEYMSVGMTKFYRVDCFRDIGGFVQQVMWDGIDCHRCRMLGWKAVSFTDPVLEFEHLRPMGSSHVSLWKGRTRHGFGQWFMGTHPLYVLASAVYRMKEPPALVGSAAILWGYAQAMVRREPRYADPDFRRFVRRYQMLALVKGKAAAVKALEREGRAAIKKD